jgi:CheY-like chemotaxis protein
MNASHRLLVIEDDTSLSSALASVLSAEGYLVDLARRGDEGCRMSARTHYDAILTDLRLPDGDGIELLEWIQANAPELPVAVITAHGHVEVAVRACVDHDDLLFDRHRHILSLLQDLDESLTASQLLLGCGVEVATKLREGRLFAVLRKFKTQSALTKMKL